MNTRQGKHMGPNKNVQLGHGLVCVRQSADSQNHHRLVVALGAAPFLGKFIWAPEADGKAKNPR